MLSTDRDQHEAHGLLRHQVRQTWRGGGSMGKTWGNMGKTWLNDGKMWLNDGKTWLNMGKHSKIWFPQKVHIQQ